MAKTSHKSKIKRYPTDLNDKKWEIINPLLPIGLSGGRSREVSLRKIINAVLYITRIVRTVITFAGQQVRYGNVSTIHCAQK